MSHELSTTITWPFGIRISTANPIDADMSAVDYQPFRYSPLSKQPGSVRLLQVLPHLQDGVLQCRLKPGFIEKDDYRALSYTWGTSAEREAILIDNHVFVVRRNLWHFLLVARHNFGDRKLWIDAICINQKDATEKSLQVSQMREIYRHSQQTLVWLGSPSTAAYERSLSDRTQDGSMKLRSLDQDWQYCQNHWWHADRRFHVSKFQETGVALEYILQYAYWERIWIVQEFFLSPFPVVIAGCVCIGAQALVDMVALVAQLPTEVDHALCEFTDLHKINRHRRLQQCLNIGQQYQYTRARRALGLEDGAATSCDPFSTRCCSLISKAFWFGKWKATAEIDRCFCRKTKANPMAFSMLTGNTCMSEVQEYLDAWDRCENRVKYFKLFDASKSTDPRDKIYALLGMSRKSLGLTADYAISARELFSICCMHFQVGATRSMAPEALQLFTSIMRTLSLSPLELFYSNDCAVSLNDMRLPGARLHCSFCEKAFPCTAIEDEYHWDEDNRPNEFILMICTAHWPSRGHVKDLRKYSNYHLAIGSYLDSVTRLSAQTLMTWRIINMHPKSLPEMVQLTYEGRVDHLEALAGILKISALYCRATEYYFSGHFELDPYDLLLEEGSFYAHVKNTTSLTVNEGSGLDHESFYEEPLLDTLGLEGQPRTAFINNLAELNMHLRR